MADFLFLLAKINLAMAGAILIVALLRRPMRAAFHAPVAYGLWLLVPVAALASLLPPRVIAPAAQPAIAVHPVAMQIPIAKSLAQAAAQAPLDWSLLLFIAWTVGAGAMLLFMAWQQRQFHKAERLGAAGPAITGFLRPRIVIPSGFTAQFNAAEQAAILAHEAAHLARQDARINAVLALLRCLCWFNPLVHLGATWLRRDQELACDAAALACVSRIDYANALLKSQMRVLALPLGCSWPGGEHPLTERIALLKRSPLPRARQWTGAALVLSLTAFAGIAAWAAEPPQQPHVEPVPTAPSSKSLRVPKWAAEAPPTAVRQVMALRDKGGPSFMFTLEADRHQDGPNGAKLLLGNVVVHLPSALVTADEATVNYTPKGDEKSIIFTGNVQVMEDLGLLRPKTLTYDLGTAMLDLDGKTLPSGMPKYVPCTKNCKRF